MIKSSVKKPFTVLVAVIMVLLLGFVSLSRMTMDLLPSMSLPYLVVVATYPGASPERVEADVVKPLESALGTITGVENVYSTSSENYGMVQLEFEDETDMDSAMVKVSSAVQEAAASLPDGCGTPSIIELSMDMMATMYVSVSKEGSDIYELSSFVESTIQPYLERQTGVASVSSIGLVEQSVHVELDGDKIDALNDKILASVNDKLEEAKLELEEAEAQVAEGKEQLDQAQSSFGATMSSQMFNELGSTVNDTAADAKTDVDALLAEIDALRGKITDTGIAESLDSIRAELASISEKLGSGNLEAADVLEMAGSMRVILQNLEHILSQIEIPEETPELPEVDTSELPADLLELIDAVRGAVAELSGTLDSVPDMLAGLEDMVAQLTQAQLTAAVGFATASTELADGEAQLAAAREQYETAREEALASANLDQLLDVSTLAQLIYAQNFAMPVGYIDDKDDNSWLLKVGDEYETIEDLSGALLVTMDGIGDVTLGDVATVTIIDNAGESYARLNGENAIILSIYKNSTTGTNETAENCLDAFEELEEKYPGTNLVTLMNQGSYINLIVESVLSSMILGAALAIIILALFLKDFKPTVVVAISIPLSVLFALVLMYFTDISLNMMSLSGMALGIGMLVDNSIVVIENIYRLRSRGVSAPRAAVQGTKQVAGAIISSTLTTVCVFMPLVFTTGMVRDLLLPMGLCIGYCLMASLIVALTVVPAAASTILKNTKPKNHPWFDKVQDVYGKTLNWCLNHKAIPLTVSIALLAFTVWTVLNMGIVLIPDMTGDQISVSVTTPEDATREESYAMADDVMELLLSIDGVEEVGVMDGSSSSSLLSSSQSSGSYTFYVVVAEGSASSEIAAITAQINDEVSVLPYEVSASAGGMSDLTALLGSGLSVNIYGNDLEILESISNDIAEIVKGYEGYTDIATSFTDGEQTIHLSIDKDKAMADGLTVAQIYMEIATRLTTSATSTTVTVDGVTMDVNVADNTDPITVENLLNIEFETTTMDENGASVTETHKLREYATKEITTSIGAISRENQTRYVSVTASVKDGYNATLLSRELSTDLDRYANSSAMPDGYSLELGGESSTVNEMVEQMLLLMLLGLAFIYLVMVAQFQSLLSPFIVLFTVPLAFTGGMIGLLIYGQPLSLLSLMGFIILMGTVVNNGIVFVDYVNQLRLGGMDRRSALIATGKTRMRPILMTALTTILAMCQMIFSDDMAGQMGGGMSVVIVGGMLYATLMTLYIIPVIYDMMFKRKPLVVDIGSENLDDVPDDAAEFIAEALAKEQAQLETAQTCEADGQLSAGTEV